MTLQQLTAHFVVHNERQFAYVCRENETVPARIVPNITKMLRNNKEYDGFANSRADKNRPCVQTDIRRLRRTTRFEHNDRNDA